MHPGFGTGSSSSKIQRHIVYQMKSLDEYILEFMFSDVSREGVWESSNPKFLEQKAYERSCQVGFRFHILGPVV